MNYDLPLRYLARAYVKTVAPVGLNEVQAATERLVGGRAEMANVQQLDLATGHMFSRIELASRDRSWLVHLPGPSVDVTWMPGDGAVASLESFAKTASRFISTVLEAHGLRAHRLALVQEGLLETMSDAALRSTSERFMVLPPLMQVSAPFEWDWRAASKVERSFLTHNEPMNTVVSVKRVRGIMQGVPEPIDRIRVDIDTNTDPERIADRFASADATEFFTRAPSWHDGLGVELLSMIGEPA